MSEAEYPAARVEESGTPCIALSRLPELPVRLLVLGPGPEPRPLAPRLEQLAADLGAGDGVEVLQSPLESWHAPLEGVGEGRYDVVIVRPPQIPADPLQAAHAPGWLVERMAAVLAVCCTRVWIVGPAEDGEPEDAGRREDLARRVVRAGGPPAVVLPLGWASLDPAGFVKGAVEQLLNDAPVVSAVERSLGSRRPPPLLLVPQGRRLGLDLARLLEDHRARIGELTSRLRSFEREYEAFRAASDGDPAFDPLKQRLEARAEALTQARQACEEVNRDRDAAGWSRLAQDIRALSDIAAEVDADRLELRRLVARLAAARG